MGGERDRFGRAVRGARRQAGLTQYDLAERAGVSQSVVSRIERGAGNHRISSYERIAGALGLESLLEEGLRFGAAPLTYDATEEAPPQEHRRRRSDMRRGDVAVGEAYEYPPPGLLLIFHAGRWDEEGLPSTLRPDDDTTVPVRPV